MKTKRTASAGNPLSYWWNEFLFARSFEFETDLSPAEAVERLRADPETPAGCLGMKREIVIEPALEGSYTLSIEVRTRDTLASATGTIATDESTGKTRVQGSAKIGVTIHIYFIIGLALLLGACMFGQMTFKGAEELCGFIPLFAIFGFIWYLMIFYRNALIVFIGDSLAKQKRDEGDVMSETTPLENDDAAKAQRNA